MAIAARGLHIRFRKGDRWIEVVRDLDLEIATGEFVAVVGPSGSGKTSLLLTLGGMLPPAAGEVWIDELSLYQASETRRNQLRREKLSFMFQNFQLIPYLSALCNVELPLMLRGLSPQEQKEHATDLLATVGLGSHLDHRPDELSIGQQQRVALVRTLANNPAVILADEPTASLDPAMTQEVLGALGRHHTQGATVLMVTHDPSLAQQADRVYNLDTLA